jgi:hypothetical protein
MDQLFPHKHFKRSIDKFRLLSQNFNLASIISSRDVILDVNELDDEIKMNTKLLKPGPIKQSPDGRAPIKQTLQTKRTNPWVISSAPTVFNNYYDFPRAPRRFALVVRGKHSSHLDEFWLPAQSGTRPARP